MAGARTQETIIGFGKKKQSAIGTANVVGDLWRLHKLNVEPFNPNLVIEDDAEHMGKSHEFVTEQDLSHWENAFSLEKYLSSEIIAWLVTKCLGTTVKSGLGPFVYTSTPVDPAVDGLELPYVSFLQQVRPGGSSIVDEMAVGCVVEDFLVSISSGPGRDNSKVTFSMVGSGELTEPSGLVIPAATAEHKLPASSLALTIIGVDYVAAGDIVSLTWGWKNNLVPGFYPGSGAPAGAAIAGRIEYGTRVPTLTFVTRLQSGSLEWTKLKALTTGTAIITQMFNANETYTATFHQVGFKVLEKGDTDGIITAAVTCSPQYHATNGILTVAATTAIDEING